MPPMSGVLSDTCPENRLPAHNKKRPPCLESSREALEERDVEGYKRVKSGHWFRGGRDNGSATRRMRYCVRQPSREHVIVLQAAVGIRQARARRRALGRS